jgi:hypothetical protein
MTWAIICVVSALTVVGVSSVCSTGAGKAGVSQNRVLLAIFLTILAQVIQASQFVVEDYLMHDQEVHPLQLVGLKGFWGFVLCTAICIPANNAFGGPEGNGIHEDLIDTFTMLHNSPIILAFILSYVLFILFYNVAGMLVTNVFSAVHRTILEGLRTLCIWLVQLIIFYALQGTDYGSKNPDVGEPWTRWSFMQLAGFALLFTGSLMYNGIVRMPFFTYPVSAATQAQVPLLAKKALAEQT